MPDYQQTLQELHHNLTILREREAKYAGNAPIDLLNQIIDHQQAIALTEQARQGRLNEPAWREALRPLLVNIRDRSERAPETCGVSIGDVVGGIIGSIIAGGDISAEGDIVTGVKGEQSAQSDFNAQVIGSGTATVNVNYYQLTVPAPVDPDTLTAARERLAALPLDDIPPVATLPLGSRLPYAPNPHFVGREDELCELARLLKGGQTAAIDQIAAATGLGGIGKSQLAVAFAHRYGHHFAGGVYWLSFADSAAIPAEIVACAPPGSEGLELETQVRRVLSDWQSDLPRLLIFDNCEDESLLSRWRPSTGQSRVLVTSRRQHWSATLGVPTLALPTLPRAESVELLRKFRPALTDKEAGDIGAELGDLPLALHLAGSFLARYQRVTPSDYLTQLQKTNPLEHPALQGRGADYSPTDHDLHVAKTFALSCDRLAPTAEIDALARQLLARAACFAPGEPIPTALLLATLVEADALDLDDALHRLTKLGLLMVDNNTVTLHRLLVAFVQHTDPNPAAQPAVELAVLAEAKRLNQSGFPSLLLAWQSHLRYITDLATRRKDEFAASLSNAMGYHLQMIGDYDGARPYYERALAIRMSLFGLEHPSTATSINNLGGLLLDTGDSVGGRPHLEQALAIRRKVLEEKHPDIANSLNNLGSLLKAEREMAGAQSYLWEALTIRREVLGEMNRDTATSIHNWGGLLLVMGDTVGARSYIEQALALRQEIMGNSHPDTASSLNSMGAICIQEGDYATAANYVSQALTICKQRFGLNHPNTQKTQRNLCFILSKLGDAE